MPKYSQYFKRKITLKRISHHSKDFGKRGNNPESKEYPVLGYLAYVSIEKGFNSVDEVMQKGGKN